jgi:thioredoxin reductase (NADPH)
MVQKADYDLIIIGGGPAGLTAGLYAARARIKTILIEQLVPGGQVVTTDWVDNYPGFINGISGPDLSQLMLAQTQRFDLAIETNEVISLSASTDVKKIELSDRTLTAHAVIIASGASPKKLGISGENDFWGKGVSSCATCDGPFYVDQIVAAVGGGNTAVKESIFLSKFVKKVYLIHRRDKFRAETVMRESAVENDKIEIIWDSIATQIHGKTRVEGITVQNIKTDETRHFPAAACFIWIGIQPNTAFLVDDFKTDAWGFLETDMLMQTSIPGVFAAGDIRSTPTRQISTAVGDGAMAAYSTETYLEKLNL